MMHLYRAEIQPLAAFSTELQSDTLFGAFCWSYKYRKGEKALEELLQDMRGEVPRIIFSNAFPEGSLPLPLGIRDMSADFDRITGKKERKEAYQHHKIVKNARFISLDRFKEVSKGDTDGFTESLKEDKTVQQTAIHNMVSRLSGTVHKIEESGNLYEEDLIYSDLESKYHVYILSDMPEAEIKNTVELMLMLGLRKKKSTGKGAFSLNRWEEMPLFSCVEKCNAFMALSNFVPANDNPTTGFYKTLVKYGKLDREYAASETPFKKPLMFIKAGAVFRTNSYKLFYGRIVTDVARYPGVIVNGYTIAVPFYISEWEE